MAFEIPKSRLGLRQIQISKRRVPIEQIMAVQGQSPIATGIETAGNVLGGALMQRAALRREGEILARKKQDELDLLALKHQYDLELQANKPHEESFTTLGTDQKGNIVQIGNKTGKTRLIPVPGGGSLFPKTESPITAENAGKLTMLSLATKDLDDVEKMIFDKKGNPDYKLIASANVPFGGLPFSKGRDVNSLIENSVAAKLRAETGATANEGEVKSIARRFKPTIRDNPTTVKNKINRLREFMTTAIATADPRGTKLKMIGNPAGMTEFSPEEEEAYQIWKASQEQ